MKVLSSMMILLWMYFLPVSVKTQDSSVRFVFSANDSERNTFKFTDFMKFDEIKGDADKEESSPDSGMFKANFTGYTIDKSGRRCVTKVVIEEVPNFENVQTCQHFYRQYCHQTFITQYSPQQIEKCEESYIKNCYIDFEDFAYEEPVQICHRPLVKDCQIEGEEVCRKHYETECTTQLVEQEIEDDSPNCREVEVDSCKDGEDSCRRVPQTSCNITKHFSLKYKSETSCSKVPVDLCAPAGCGFTQGSEICREESKTVVREVPVEDCTLQPRTSCFQATKLVPYLEAQEECTDVPHELCTRQSKPGKIRRPLLKKWCYNPNQE